jgi:hypothetical protein
MTHAWCSDPARDAAVRAAEDGRDRPLPTLAEAIAAPFACAACGGFGMDHRCRESCEECDGSGRAMFPKSGSASSAADHENKGDGMRTERVTLEVTHGESFGVSHWSWVTILRLQSGESVRVVEQPLSDAWAKRLNRLTAERDAAIRERDDLKARVAELEAASGGGQGEPDYYVYKNEVGMILYTSPKLVNDGWGGCTIEPVYKAPPQSRGWLSEEREALRYASQGLREAGGISNVQAMKQIDALLVRSSPPEVVLPNVYDHIGLRPVYLRADVIKALAAAGVAVKEVQ